MGEYTSFPQNKTKPISPIQSNLIQSNHSLVLAGEKKRKAVPLRIFQDLVFLSGRIGFMVHSTRQRQHVKRRTQASTLTHTYTSITRGVFHFFTIRFFRFLFF